MFGTSDRLTSLTPEQEEQIPRFRNEWLAIGLSTEPADREMAERSIDLAYRAAGLEPPALKIWLDSPLASVIGAALLPSLLTLSNQLGNQPGHQVQGQVWNQIYDQIGEQVQDQVWERVWYQIGVQVWGQVFGQVGVRVWGQVQDLSWEQVGRQIHDQVEWQVQGQVQGQVRAQVWDQVEWEVYGQVQDLFWEQVGRQVHDQVGDQVKWQVHDQFLDQVEWQVWGRVGRQVRHLIWSQIWEQLGWTGIEVRSQIYPCGDGSLDAYWVGQYAYFRDVCGVTGIEQLQGIMGLTRSCGWWWPFAGAVILTERPCAFHQDEQDRLHCEDGPALSYPDGFGVWAIHGVRVPRQVVEAPETLTVEQIRGEKNAEVQRVMLERFGTERWIHETGACLVHRDDFGTVWRTEAIDEVLGPDGRWVAAPYYAVQVVNGTPEPDGSFREFFLRVDAWCRPMRLVNGAYVFGEPQEMTGLNAVASTYGLTGEVYASGLILRT